MIDVEARPSQRRRMHTHLPLASRVPPHTYFLVSAVFHYLGPAFAVLLFANVDVLGVAWLRIASAALVFALWRRPWRAIPDWSPAQRRDLVLLGVVLAAMNSCFYLAIARLPLGTVGAIEFVGPIVLAAVAVRSARNALALGLTVFGVTLLTDVHLRSDLSGLVFAAANCLLFMLYVILGHRIAQETPQHATTMRATSIDRLGAAMLVAFVAMTPLGLLSAGAALTRVDLLLAGAGVGICSSVIPYVCDQLAMARLPRSTFALLPATAVSIGILVLGQIPAMVELLGVAAIASGILVHRAAEAS